MSKLLNLLLNKSINDYRAHFKSQKEEKVVLGKRGKLFTTYLKDNPTEPKLQIGCGYNVVEGWLNTDLSHNDNVAFLNAASDYPFAHNTFQFIFSEHLFEHLTLPQEFKMLEECFRVLKPGGVLRLALPSAEFITDVLQESEATKAYVNWAVENVPALKFVKANFDTDDDYAIYVVNNFYRDWGHEVIHNIKSLRNLLTKKGFVNVKSCEVSISEHTPLHAMERHMNIIPPEFNLLETMVVEGTKPA